MYANEWVVSQEERGQCGISVQERESLCISVQMLGDMRKKNEWDGEETSRSGGFCYCSLALSSAWAAD